jgi:hypothetical protein
VVSAAFDEWYGDMAGGEPEQQEDEDLATFRSWLQSLRK